MRTNKTGFVAAFFSLFLFAAAARPDTGAVSEELSVVQAIAKALATESAQPYDFLYFESDFSARKNVAASLADPDRTQFCGLSRDEGLALVKQITFLNMEPLAFDKNVARVAGLGIGHKQFERFRYIRVSRVVFAPDQQRAWLAADLNGESGALYRLDKIGGEWSRAARCGGWVRAVD
jgi:hypothetical protein